LFSLLNFIYLKALSSNTSFLNPSVLTRGTSLPCNYLYEPGLILQTSLLASSMLPDGAEAQLDDWTVFFLNQKPFNTISPVLALDSPNIQTTALPGCNAEDSKSSKPELLCVLNLVRTKHDKTLDRYVHRRRSSSLLNTLLRSGAKVLALAICTRHSYIQIFKARSILDVAKNSSKHCSRIALFVARNRRLFYRSFSRLSSSPI